MNPTIPRELVQLAQWVCWRSIMRDGKRTKVPFRPDGSTASVIDPATWSAHSEVAAAAHKFDGVGIVLTNSDPYAGMDIDGCVNKGGIIHPRAADYIRQLNSYAEYTPSGDGVRIWVRGKLPPKGRRKTSKCDPFRSIEFYDDKRFFTITGSHIPGTPEIIEDRGEVLLAVHSEVFANDGPPPTTPSRKLSARAGASDDQVLARARRSKNGPKFQALFDHGDLAGYGGDHSAADLALCSILAFHSNGDAAMVERLFGRSALARDKWSDRPDYRERTISVAISSLAARNGERTSTRPVPQSTEPDQLVLDPKSPLVTARRFLSVRYSHPEIHTLHFWNGDFYEWRTSHYQPGPDQVRAGVYEFLDGALRVGRSGLEPFNPTKAKVDNVIDALRSCVTLDAGAPRWLLGSRDCSPTEIVSAANGLVDLQSGDLHPHTPRYFNLAALDYEFNPSALEPVLWLEFLQQVFDGDAESIDLLQEFMGYSLTPDTSLQKLLLMVGPPRAGKGTIVRVWTCMLGRWNVVSPTLSSLEQNFGMAPLVGKLLAVLSDARLSAKADASRILERLLSISGEDDQTVDRKFKEPFVGRLPVRFVIVTNEIPKLADPSGAFASRVMALAFPKSFQGQEDKDLAHKLMAEVASILNWAIAGRRRLYSRGHFVAPAMSTDLARCVAEVASPVAAFVRECCILAPVASVPFSALFEAWLVWCSDRQVDGTQDCGAFARELRAAYPILSHFRSRDGTNRVRHYRGIDLRPGPGWSRTNPIAREGESTSMEGGKE